MRLPHKPLRYAGPARLLPSALVFLALFGPWTANHARADAPNLIASPPNDYDVMRLPGNTRPDALAEIDRGAVPASFTMNRLQIVLKRSSVQEAALEEFMDEQTDPDSAHFHEWLQPEEFGELYGPSADDLRYLTGWLESHGFTIDQVNKGRTFVEFHGTAARVNATFHTQMHWYAILGDLYYANNADPSIPSALAPVVAGVSMLNDFPRHAMHTPTHAVHRDPATGKWKFNGSAQYLPPANDGEYLYEGVGPYDFATIYNVLPLWNAGITGTGQTIAIAGDSDIDLADVATFRSFFGLPANVPTKIFNGASPGYTGSRIENSLDVEWSGAVAKNATITLVITADTANAQNVENGEIFSAQYIVDNDLAPVMSFSYGDCELKSGTSLNATFNTLWQQAAAEGVSVFVSAGDQASAGCDSGFPQGAKDGLQVNGWASTPYNTAVGGTDFNWINLTTAYWAQSNSATESNALSYIPEVPWNGSCAGAAVELAYGFTAAGYNQVGSCEEVPDADVDVQLLVVAGGSGGVSACTKPTGTTPATCAGGYAKPKWQAGLGVPADGKRDLPDVSLFAADSVLADAYIMCDSSSTPCDFTSGSDIVAQAVGGTSVASPAMAGIMALVVQKIGARQGNANPALYALAAKDNRASCNSVSVAAGNACNFYDITTDTNAVPCHVGTLDCNAPSGDTVVGVLSGYSSTTGYDLTTGLGSVNAYNLVNNWHTVNSAKAFAQLSASVLQFASTAVGATSASKTVTLKNTGNKTLTVTSITTAGTDATSFTVPSQTCGATLAAGASCTFDVAFAPTAAGKLSGTIEIKDNVLGSPQKITVRGTGTG